MGPWHSRARPSHRNPNLQPLGKVRRPHTQGRWCRIGCGTLQNPLQSTQTSRGFPSFFPSSLNPLPPHPSSPFCPCLPSISLSRVNFGTQTASPLYSPAALSSCSTYSCQAQPKVFNRGLCAKQKITLFKSRCVMQTSGRGGERTRGPSSYSSTGWLGHFSQ